MNAPIKDARRRRRYLAAMGIDVYVARDRATASLAQAADGPGVAEGSVASPAVAERSRVDAEQEHGPGQSLETARALLDEVPPVPAEPPPSSAPPSAPPSEAAEDAAPGPDTGPTEGAPDATLHFRLRALRCGLGLLLVDEDALPEMRREALLRLGDLLRSGLAVRGDDLSARIESQAFFWPQVDAAHVDQSRPRAEEALTAWVRRCTNDGEGFLIVVEGTTPSPAPLGVLETLPVRRARIPAAFLAGADPAVHRDAWRALDVLAVAAP